MRKILRDLLEEKGRLYGCFIQIPSPEVVEMAKDYDYVIIDYEHGHMSQEQLLAMIRAADGVDLAVMVRVPAMDPMVIHKVLDMGVNSLLVPDVGNREEARRLAEMTHFAPQGDRGACPFTRANDYGFGCDRSAYYEKANRDVFVIATIEGLEGVRDMEEIIGLGGIDGIGTGQFDLSVALGVPGQINHPKVQAVARQAAEAAKKCGKVYTTMVMEPQEAADIDREVCRLVMCGAPELHLQAYLKETVKKLREIAG